MAIDYRDTWAATVRCAPVRRPEPQANTHRYPNDAGILHRAQVTEARPLQSVGTPIASPPTDDIGLHATADTIR